MPTAVTHLISAREFFEMPEPADGSRQELVRGEIHVMPPGGGLHGVCCSRVDRRIGNYVDAHKLGEVASNDTGFITAQEPDSVRGPDVAFWSKERLKEIPIGYMTMAPDLAVEVLSPSNTSKLIREKLGEYFERGVRMVWVLAPEDRTLTIYRAADQGRIYHETATISGEDVLPGFECKVSDFLP
ncbi:MAG: Uma2 family endonuclease [Gemmataceae bacterium]